MLFFKSTVACIVCSSVLATSCLGQYGPKPAAPPASEEGYYGKILAAPPASEEGYYAHVNGSGWNIAGYEERNCYDHLNPAVRKRYPMFPKEAIKVCNRALEHLTQAGNYRKAAVLERTMAMEFIYPTGRFPPDRQRGLVLLVSAAFEGRSSVGCRSQDDLPALMELGKELWTGEVGINANGQLYAASVAGRGETIEQKASRMSYGRQLMVCAEQSETDRTNATTAHQWLATMRESEIPVDMTSSNQQATMRSYSPGASKPSANDNSSHSTANSDTTSELLKGAVVIGGAALLLGLLFGGSKGSDSTSDNGSKYPLGDPHDPMAHGYTSKSCSDYKLGKEGSSGFSCY